MMKLLYLLQSELASKLQKRSHPGSSSSAGAAKGSKLSPNHHGSSDIENTLRVSNFIGSGFSVEKC